MIQSMVCVVCWRAWIDNGWDHFTAIFYYLLFHGIGFLEFLGDRFPKVVYIHKGQFVFMQLY